MKNVIIALGLTLATSTAAFAGGSALDAVLLPQDTATYNMSANISTDGINNNQTTFDRLGSGSPMFDNSVDYSATASFNNSTNTVTSPRLGDGILPY